MSEVTLRKIEKSGHQNMAIYKTALFNGIFCMVFQDNIFGMMLLNHFLEMIRNRYKPETLELILEDDIEIKDKRLFKFIMKHFKSDDVKES